MDEQQNETPAASPLRRAWPLLALAGAMLGAYAMGLQDYISFKTIGTNYEALKAAIATRFIESLAVYVLLYVAVVALSLPGGLIMTLTGGLLFGWQVGAVATVVAATLGATIVFFIAKSAIGESLAAKAGPSLASLREGFQNDALSYLLFLRLVPIFPFVIVNLAPALLGVALPTYVLGTFLGIIPGTIAFSIAGSGLGSVVEAQNRSYEECQARAVGAPSAEDCSFVVDTSALVTPELLAAFVALGVVALIPVALKRLRGRHAEKRS